MPLAIHDYFSLGSINIGDRLVARAIQPAIERYFGPAEFVDVPVNDRCPGDRPICLRGENVECTNREADILSDVTGKFARLRPIGEMTLTPVSASARPVH